MIGSNPLSLSYGLVIAVVLSACQAPQYAGQQPIGCAEKGILGNLLAPYAPCPQRAYAVPNSAEPQPYPMMGATVYGPGECVGPVIMGECHGAIVPQAGYHRTCHGAWMNGQCAGPMF